MLKTFALSVVFLAMAMACAQALAQPGSDLSLIPAGYEKQCALPSLPVFNVRDYGALGNDSADDTPAIRGAIQAASASGGIVYLPSGTYRVCPQPGDNFPTGWRRPIFHCTANNLVFCGDGPGRTILSGWMPGLNDPKTSWTLTGDSSTPCQRFSMFDTSFQAAKDPVCNLQIRSLSITGNAGWTGKYGPWCDPATGDGWDTTHKCFTYYGCAGQTNILVFNVEMHDWRGESIYCGSQTPTSCNIVLTAIWGSNASAISVNGCTAKNVTLGGPTNDHKLYNGCENFCRVPGSATNFVDSSSQGCANGLVLIGLPGTTARIENHKFTDNYRGVLCSEKLYGLRLKNAAFSNNFQCVITSALGLYPDTPTGFGDFGIDGCTVSNGGILFTNQNYGVDNTRGFDNLSLTHNVIGANGRLLEGAFWGPTYKNFVVDSNTIMAKASLAATYQGHAPLVTNTKYLDGSYVQDFMAPNDTSLFVIPWMADQVILSWHNHSPQFAGLDPALLYLYPEGFQTTINVWSLGWTLKADPAWNTFSNDVPVTQTGVKIKKTNGLFDLVP